MKLVAKVKILANSEQALALRQTIEVANSACNVISHHAWNTKTFRQFHLHRLTYKIIRNSFPLAAQVVVRCIAKVSDAYKADQKSMRSFRPNGAVAYDFHILRWYPERREISIWTITGRLRIPFACGEKQLALLRYQHGESDLCIIGDNIYLYATCNIEEPQQKSEDGVLGVDLGLVNLAADSDGDLYSGAKVEENRRKYSHRRRNLQRKQTKAAKRKLKNISGRQRRFQTHVNHEISKRIVQKAKDTGRAIALEELGGIRDRVTVPRKQRARHANWSYNQLRKYISYKAALAGILVMYVDPRNTSRTCPKCGHVDKRNRVTQSTFSCVSCGYSAPADTTAAVNIAARAAVNRPLISACTICQG